MRLSPALLQAIAPRARASYREAFQREDVLRASGLLERPLRLAHFLSQVCHETAGLTVLVEHLTYTADRLTVVWPSRFPTPAAAAPFAGDPRALANKVYGARMGNVGPDDGWRYIGRGLLQLTGRTNYARVGRALGLDLETSPYLAASAEHALAIAVEIWRAAGCMAHADADDVVQVTRAINGGTVGLADRRAWLAKTKALVLHLDSQGV
jgi:putative chitinase